MAAKEVVSGEVQAEIRSWQKLTTLNDQVSVMENELYVLKTSTQEGFGALERDTQETVKSAVADMKDYVDLQARMRPVHKKSLACSGEDDLQDNYRLVCKVTMFVKLMIYGCQT